MNRADVLLEHEQNVTYIDFCSAAPPPAAEQGEAAWWPWAEAEESVSGKTPVATTSLPARWSPRPCRVLADRFARSRLRADLRDWALLVAFLTGGVLGLALADLMHSLTHIPTGGTP
ncbi:hypothetical protein [Blastococcus sp. CT_GayMR16]|uniref:hypothetical protein n=1 Tax=Blastococcus sp. CT_GayMR16 TaxID=2559607 RepID=UPI0010744596|nr:hypothetical protein [Blastococcus sp. CT_GayMR16]TFV90436.1 hypothetical protein E4P38_03080 [Blastococcus sp. CT_GayMR16]